MTMLHIKIIILLIFLYPAFGFTDGTIKSSVSEMIQALEVDAEALIERGQWNTERNILVIHSSEAAGSLYAFLRQENNQYIAVNLSYLVNSEYNGKLGQSKAYYDDYQQSVILSEGVGEYAVGISVKTMAWKNGLRYTVQQKPTYLKLTGETLDP